MKLIEIIAVLVAANLVITIFNHLKLRQMANEIQELTTEVAETKGIMASAKVLIEGFAEALRKAGTDPAKLKALREDLSAGSDDLAAGIANNPLPTEVIVPPEPPI